MEIDYRCEHSAAIFVPIEQQDFQMKYKGKKNEEKK